VLASFSSLLTPMITMKAISGTDAKAGRTVRGASQAEVSAALGINRTYYSLFENGRYSLSNDEEARRILRNQREQ
jgi:transcriptional regulator with XRE-family HTH domain